jgi:hypothetical protein
VGNTTHVSALEDDVNSLDFNKKEKNYTNQIGGGRGCGTFLLDAMSLYVGTIMVWVLTQ